MLLLAEALSPRVGDLIAFALTLRPVVGLLGMSRGKTYHETIFEPSDHPTLARRDAR
jgi:hypothetical protein